MQFISDTQYSMTIQFIISSEHLNQRLDNFLVSRLKGIPKSCIYRLIRQGKIRINRKKKSARYRAQTHDLIEVPNLRLGELEKPIPQPSPSLRKLLVESILFENKDLLVLNKPHGLAVHGGSGISLGLIESIRQLYPNNLLELGHRLDRDTSGCIIITKKPSILKAVHALFREGRIKKTYQMLVKGHWPSQIKQIDIPLQKNQMKSGERMVMADKTGKPSLTYFKVLQYFANSTLLEASLRTGRTHQIRVHTQYAKHPIIGDEKYGDKTVNRLLRETGLKRLFLHASKLAFTLPNSSEVFQTKAPIPTDLETILKKLASQ